MIALDTNILVAAHRREYPAHEHALSLVRERAEGTAPWALPWPCLHEFLAVVTNARIFVEPTPLPEALGVLDALLESPSLRLLSESPGYWPLLKSLSTAGGIAGARVHDARIAALCLHNGVSELWTADRDFSRFPKLKWRNPFVGRAGA
jgi:toxin-antitoxin system PIN domain toxin